uniref:HNH nuclease domain-containing protein n=1 Tax=Bionectria ochroleuca TaxID=29856 RepID=A0A8H7NPJ1_BIOOC
MPPEPLHRHQSSLEGILDFSSQPPLDPIRREAAARLFNKLIDCVDDTLPAGRNDDYNRVKLVRLTYEYARTDESKGNFLRAFFDSAGIPIVNTFNGEEVDLADADQRAALHNSILNFADYLFENFFLPLKASTRKTPQPSPASHSAIRHLQGDLAFLGTPERVSALRGACLVRDRHRCVITRRFDLNEANSRAKLASREGTVARDDDGNPFDNTTSFSALEVAHIIPHSLTRLNASNELHASKATALAILNMFDNGAAYLIEGVNIDRPSNAITLTHDMHYGFGAFNIFFDPIEDQVHTYRIKPFLSFNLYENLPVTRTLYLTESRTIDPLCHAYSQFITPLGIFFTCLVLVNILMRF